MQDGRTRTVQNKENLKNEIIAKYSRKFTSKHFGEHSELKISTIISSATLFSRVTYLRSHPSIGHRQRTKITNFIWIYKIISQPERNNILIAILQSYLPKYIILHTTFNITNTIFTTLPANTSIQRKFFSHNGVPSEWRGIVHTSKPEVRAERNIRGKLVLLCANTHFSSMRIKSRQSLANRVWPVRFEFTRLSRKWEEKREQGERWKVKRESWEEEVGPQQNSLKIVYSVFCCGGDCCDFPVSRFSASLTGKKNDHSILCRIVELKSVNLPQKKPVRKKRERPGSDFLHIVLIALCKKRWFVMSLYNMKLKWQW